MRQGNIGIIVMLTAYSKCLTNSRPSIGEDNGEDDDGGGGDYYGGGEFIFSNLNMVGKKELKG